MDGATVPVPDEALEEAQEAQDKTEQVVWAKQRES